MRVIDADRLQKQFDEKSINPNYRVNMHSIKSIISNAPTVDAIPIDWLKEKLTNHPELSYAVTDGINNVLDLWEQQGEQEHGQ